MVLEVVALLVVVVVASVVLLVVVKEAVAVRKLSEDVVLLEVEAEAEAVDGDVVGEDDWEEFFDVELSSMFVLSVLS